MYSIVQEFRIIQIKKSINTYNSHCNSNRGNQLVKSPSNVIVDIHSRTSSHHSSKSYKSGNSSANSASYLAVIEKRKSTECAKALAVQAEERAKRTITLLEKKKALELEMEKESVTNEVIEPRNKASIAEIELRYEEEACQTNNLSGYARSIISKQNRKLEKPFQEKIQKSVTIGDIQHDAVNHIDICRNENDFTNFNIEANSYKETQHDGLYPPHLVNVAKGNSSRLSTVKPESIDKFIDDLIEGQETSLVFEHPSLSLQLALNQ